RQRTCGHGRAGVEVERGIEVDRSHGHGGERREGDARTEVEGAADDRDRGHGVEDSGPCADRDGPAAEIPQADIAADCVAAAEADRAAVPLQTARDVVNTAPGARDGASAELGEAGAADPGAVEGVVAAAVEAERGPAADAETAPGGSAATGQRQLIRGHVDR